MNDLILYVFIFLAIVFSALYSGCETGLYAFNPLKVSKKEGGNISTLLRLLKRRDVLVITCLVGNNIAIELATRFFGKTVNSFGVSEETLHLLELLILIPVLFLIGEIIPKGLFTFKANVILPKLVWFLWLSRLLLSPFVFLMQLAVRFVSAIAGQPDQADYTESRQRFKWVLQDPDGGLSTDQSRMVRNILALQDRLVTSIMKPIKSVDMIDINLSLDETQEHFHQSGVNYLVVYEKEKSNILGVVFVSPVLLADPHQKLRDFLMVIPELSHKENLISALSELKKDNLPVAKVKNANGNVMGIVFTRQIIKEVVGDVPQWLYN